MRTENDRRSAESSYQCASIQHCLVCRTRLAGSSLHSSRVLNCSKCELPKALQSLAARKHCTGRFGAGGDWSRDGRIYTLREGARRGWSSQLSVREALALINEMLDEVLAEQEGDFDAETRLAVCVVRTIGL